MTEEERCLCITSILRQYPDFIMSIGVYDAVYTGNVQSILFDVKYYVMINNEMIKLDSINYILQKFLIFLHEKRQIRIILQLEALL